MFGQDSPPQMEPEPDPWGAARRRNASDGPDGIPFDDPRLAPRRPDAVAFVDGPPSDDSAPDEPPPRRARAAPKAHWEGVICNPDDGQLESIYRWSPPAPIHHDADYIIVGYNNGGVQNACPHARVYAELVGKVRIDQLGSWHPGWRWKGRYLSARDARGRCSGEGFVFRERGTISCDRKPNNISNYWQSLTQSIRSKRTWKEVLDCPELQPSVAKCMSWTRSQFAYRNSQRSTLDLRRPGYQYQIRFELFLTRVKPDPRCVIWAWEPVGSIGKSQFTKHMVMEHRIMIGSTVNSSNACMFEGQTIVIFDLPRQELEPPWESVEMLKCGAPNICCYIQWR